MSEFMSITVHELIDNLEIFDRNNTVYICDTGDDLDLESIESGWEQTNFKIIKKNIISVLHKNFNVKIRLCS